MKNRYEIPPTAGLLPRWSDLFSKRDLVSGLKHLPGISDPLITCSGTAAFIIALSFLKKHSNRTEVIVPAYTCPLVALAVHHCGLKLTLCDLAPAHFDFDFLRLSQLAGKNTLAIVPTHLGGRLADIRLARQIADKSGAVLIEDAAQALGANITHQADMTFFSLAAGKGLSIYEGGILTANTPGTSEQLKKTAQEVIHPSRRHEWRRCMEFLAYTAFYHPAGLYYAYGKPRRKALEKGRLEDAVGDVFPIDIPLHPVGKWRQHAGAKALLRLPDFLRQTKQQALARCQRLKKIQGVHVFEDSAGKKGVWPLLMILMPSRTCRDQVMAVLWDSPFGISRLFIHALPGYRYLATIVPQVDTPRASDFADRLLTVTNSLWLDDAHFAHICKVIESVTRKAPPPAG